MLLTAIMLIGSVVVYAELKGTSPSNIELNKEKKLENTQESEQVEQDKGTTFPSLPIAEITGTDNRLYSQNESEGVYAGFLLDWEGKSAEFEWKSVASSAVPVELLSVDVTGDGTKDAIVTLPVASGTGVYVEEIHVVNGQTLQEEQVEDAAAAAVKWAASNPELNEQDELLMNHIDYQINEDNQLTAIIGVAISPSVYIGELTLTYVYDNHEEVLKVNTVSYAAFE